MQEVGGLSPCIELVDVAVDDFLESEGTQAGMGVVHVSAEVRVKRCRSSMQTNNYYSIMMVIESRPLSSSVHQCYLPCSTRGAPDLPPYFRPYSPHSEVRWFQALSVAAPTSSMLRSP